VIDPDECIDCTLCVEECPVGAIFPELDVPAGQEIYMSINAELAKEWPVLTSKIPRWKTPQVGRRTEQAAAAQALSPPGTSPCCGGAKRFMVGGRCVDGGTRTTASIRASRFDTQGGSVSPPCCATGLRALILPEERR
jgi:4Fe-4S binding domain./Domain of unknown function (DUF3470).